jgi:hypothetical protein
VDVNGLDIVGYPFSSNPFTSLSCVAVPPREQKFAPELTLLRSWGDATLGRVSRVKARVSRLNAMAPK